jgi:spore germination cell wall hydrolase CwlJ-like protein
VALVVREELGAVDHFHTVSSSPDWAARMDYVATLAKHRFYAETDRHQKGRISQENRLALLYFWYGITS